MAALAVLPEVYYDLTGPETEYLLSGVFDRQLDSLRQTRILATLLHNAHFKDPMSDHEFMPLPGDQIRERAQTSPEQAFAMLASAMGGTITEEPSTA